MIRPIDGRVTQGRGALSPRAARLLKQARTRRGLTLRRAAREVGVNPGYLSRLERGLRRPSIEVACRLIWIFEMDPATRVALLLEAATGTRAEQSIRLKRG